MDNPISIAAAKASHLGIWVERLALMLAGALLSLAFAPTFWAPVIFLSFPLFFAFLDLAPSARAAFARSWWFGFGLLVTGLNWIGHSFSQQDAFPPALAPVAVLTMTAGLALYYGLMGYLYHILKTKASVRGLSRYFLFAALWILCEALRSYFLTGFPWHLIATLWAGWLSVAQSVYYLSVFGTGFVTLLVGLSPMMFLDGRAQMGKDRFLSYAVVLLVTLSFSGMAYLGRTRLQETPTTYHSDVPLRVVQANIPQSEKWASHKIDDHFDKHLRQSRRKSVTGKADGKRLLIWPETAVQTEYFDRENSIERYRLAMMLEKGSYAITGVPRVEMRAGRLSFYNSMMAINKQREIYMRYDKTDLVPFAEYLPFKGLLNAVGLESLTGSYFSKGRGRVIAELPDIPAFSPLICYEIIFPGLATKAPVPGQPRAEWLLNITNDAWFGRSAGPYQHLALVQIRAIEEGVPVVRAANTGVSAVIDPLGRILREIPVGVADVLDMDLPRAVAESSLSSLQKIVFSLLICFIFPLITLIRIIRK